MTIGNAPAWGAMSQPGSSTALTDEQLESFGPPDPRILVCGCGGSGNNTMNRITHIGVEGAITVAINTDKQHWTILGLSKSYSLGGISQEGSEATPIWAGRLQKLGEA